MELAKAELTELKKEVVEAMEGQLKRYASSTHTPLFALVVPQFFQGF